MKLEVDELIYTITDIISHIFIFFICLWKSFERQRQSLYKFHLHFALNDVIFWFFISINSFLDLCKLYRIWMKLNHHANSYKSEYTITFCHELTKIKVINHFKSWHVFNKNASTFWFEHDFLLKINLLFFLH